MVLVALASFYSISFSLSFRLNTIELALAYSKESLLANMFIEMLELVESSILNLNGYLR